MIRAILFDYDGVLVHTEEHFFTAGAQAMSDAAVSYTRADFERHTFETDLGTSGFLRERGYDDEFISVLKEKRNQIWKSLVTKGGVVDPHAKEVLQTLGETYTVGIVTNSPQHLFAAIDSQEQLSSLVDFVLTREAYDKGKASPDGYEKGLVLADASPSETIVIEDSPRGLASAQAAGMQVVMVKNPHFPDFDMTKADFYLETLADLPELLTSLSVAS